MGAIFDFISGIADGVSAAIEFLGGLISDLAYVVTLIAETVTSIPTYFSWLPAPVLALLTSILAVVVIYKILGRD